MIYLIWGAPSQGKTYYATYEAIVALLEGKRVFSNYPIIFINPLPGYKKIINFFYWFAKKKAKYIPKEYSTYKWEDDYVYKNLTNCTIILDEAYRYFSSHKRSVEDDTHLFFATNGHADLDIYLIAQHFNRINLTIREMASYYVWVEKINNIFSLKGRRKGELTPLFFRIEAYITEDDFKMRRIKNTIYAFKRIWFSKLVANAYNTQFFKGIEKPLSPKKWSEVIKGNVEVVLFKNLDKERIDEEKMKEEFING